MTLRVVAESEAAPTRRSANAPVPPFINSTNAASNNANPPCVMAMYHKPAFRTRSSPDSVITRKYEASDMPSHISKNVSTLSARVTRLIVSKNKLNITPSKGSEARPSL